ncbi:hypothetical protein PINS_up008382 [Pythium insidiosum]|nr:hypothetical protein PINS_up008382 [Pythium insidiosum]
MINQLGVCESMRLAGYDPALDYTVAIAKGLSGPDFHNPASNDTQIYQFPAFNVTYCASTDAVCQRCRDEIFPKSPPDSRFCVGEFGCVCIAACESASWTDIATGGECQPPPVVTERKDKKPRGDGKGRDQSDFGWRDVLTQAVAPVVTGVLAMIALWKYFQVRHQLMAIKQDEMRDDDDHSSSLTMRSSQSHSDDSRRFDEAGGSVPRFVGSTEDQSPSQHYRRLGPDSTAESTDRTVCAIPVVLVSSGKGTPETDGVLEAIELRMVQPSAPGFDDDTDERAPRSGA